MYRINGGKIKVEGDVTRQLHVYCRADYMLMFVHVNVLFLPLFGATGSPSPCVNKQREVN